MNEQLRLAIVLGTRPEIIKLAPLIRECEQRGIEYTLIHTGQHYSDDLDSVFFKKLGLRSPDYNLEVGSKSHGDQTGEMLQGIEETVIAENPDVVLVQGDTNSVLAGAIATSKLESELGHVEAGLRSYDRNMPEEVNRRLTDHASDYLFAPTDDAAGLLYNEGIPEERVHVTGNTIVDAVLEHREIASEQSDVLSQLGLNQTAYAILTAHRPENVDSKYRFRNLLDGVARVAEQFDLDVVYPIHPRAEKRLEQFEIVVPSEIRLIEPQDYIDFLQLEQEAELILTDSGGVQEEACILEVPCVTLRANTERPESIKVGANRLAGTQPADVIECAEEMLRTEATWPNPFGDGSAGEQILEKLQHERGT